MTPPLMGWRAFALAARATAGPRSAAAGRAPAILPVAVAALASILAAAPARAAADAPDSALAHQIVEAGLEGVAVSRSGPVLDVAYENRRYRHPTDALGRITRLARAGSPPDSVRAIERRLGLASAAFTFATAETPERVLYPGDPAFPRAPAGRRFGATERSLDLLLRPLVTYELGRIFDPVLLRIELAPELRINPWPGARARASLVIPLRNDFPPDAIHPDVDRVRPGVTSLEQFTWLPWSILASACGGIFGDNRYGASAGAWRPFAGGRAWLDAQADLTGYLAFTDTGVVYSDPTRWTGFAGVAFRPGALAATLRFRAERFLYGDNGIEVQVERSFGDVDLAIFARRVEDNSNGGVRLTVPLPPLDRGVGTPVRAQLTETFAIEYQNEVGFDGIELSGVASREDFMRDLDPSALGASRARYRRAAGGAPVEGPPRLPESVSLAGMTGMINTPWCGVEHEGEFEIGYNSISKGAAYDHRDEYRNDVYYGTIGYLPNFELGLRWTMIPGLKSFSDLVPDSELTDSDRMISGRLMLLPPGPRRPGLAVGIEDAIGTRRFHSTYAVTGIELEKALRSRFTLGYAPRVLTASQHTLDGAFGAISVRPWRGFAFALEYDTEKTNVLVGLEAATGFRARVALLELRHLAVGFGWSHSL